MRNKTIWIVLTAFLLALTTAGCPQLLTLTLPTDDRPCAQEDQQAGGEDQGEEASEDQEQEGGEGEEAEEEEGEGTQEGDQDQGQEEDQGGDQTGDQDTGQTTADAAAGQAFFEAHNCAACHGADASGGFGPSLVGEEAAEILDRLDGTESHTGGTVDGVTQQDAENLAAWLATL